MRRGVAYFGVIVVLSGLLVSPAAGSGAPAGEPVDADEPMLHVELADDGDAVVSLVSVYDFADEDEREAFETLETDDEARTELLDRYTDRMQSTAENADDGLEREMMVTADSIDVHAADDRGVVVLSVNWQELATVEDSRLVVTEPFASSYESDRPVVIVGPDGSTVEATTPEPDVETDQQTRWNGGTDFDGFEAAFSLTTADGTDGTGDDSLPGFGVAVTGAALLALSGVALRHDQ